jgi:hypothetical protein
VSLDQLEAGAQDEFLLAATAQNLRRIAKRLMPSGEEKWAWAGVK